MKIKALTLALLILICQTVRAQNPAIESLKRTAESATGKEKIIALANLSKNFSSVDPKAGIDYGKQALQLAVLLKIPSVKSIAYNNIGLNFMILTEYKTARSYYDSAFQNAVFFRDSLQLSGYYCRMGILYETLGQLDSSITSFQKELVINRKLKIDKSIGKSLENIGTIHMHRGEFTSSIKYFLEAKTFYEKAGFKNALPALYLRLGQIYCETNDLKEAEKQFKKGVELSLAQQDFNNAGIGMNALGILFSKQNKLEDALQAYQEALKIIGSLNNLSLKEAIFTNMGTIFSEQGKFQKALDYHQKALEVNRKLNSPFSLAQSENNIADVYLAMKEYSKARAWYENALTTFTSLNAYSQLIYTYKGLITTNNELLDYRQSVKYYQLFNQVKDSLNRYELGRALDSLKVTYHTAETDRENLLLQQQTELQSKTISLQRIILFSSFFGIALIIIIVIIIIRSRRRIQKINALLETKNLEISAKATELKETNDKLLELSRFKESMTSFLVHDLKNPLSTIIHFDHDHFTEDQWIAVKNSGKKMLNIVLNLLDISKYSNNTMELKTENVSIKDMINRAFKETSFLSEQKSIQFKLTSLTDFLVHADIDIVERIFVNLFSNAIKYSQPGSVVQVSTEPMGQDKVKIIVKDEGEGINAEFLPMIFDKFTQFSPKNSGRTRSTGIGLAFCKLAVEAHSGEIGVDSVQGMGASFWFTLPLATTQIESRLSPCEENLPSPKVMNIQLSDIERKLLLPYCEKLKILSVFQVTDVKEIINAIDIQNSEMITIWKTKLLTALSTCNKIKYNELLNSVFHGEI